ncbi:MAG TPA: flagellar M-ring protein FliF, partial [Chromatiaceae bacterium]|nr:flagellar M-ring protein FliF [Chromatiaceae bacterium]
MVPVGEDGSLPEAVAEAPPQPGDWRQNPVVKQLAAMVGIALSVAIGVAVVLWSQTPGYSMLFANLAQKDATEIMDVLQQSGVEYRVDEASGALLVPSAKIQ